MLVVGLVTVRVLGVETFGAFSLAFATGIALLQFVPDAASAYFARSRWVNSSTYGDAPFENKMAKVAGDSALLTLATLITLSALMIAALYFVEPYASDAELRRTTQVLAVACPLFGAGQVLTAQLAINGYERRALYQSLVLGAAQTAFPIVGMHLGGLLGLAYGLLTAIVLYAVLAYLNARRLLSLGKYRSNDKFLSRVTSTVIGSVGLSRLTVSLLLGAPVHWFVLRTLGAENNGLYEVGSFSYAYYFYTFMILVPSSLQSYFVGMIARRQSDETEHETRKSSSRLLWYAALLAAGAAIVFSVVHTFVSPAVLDTDSFQRLIPGYVCIAAGAVGILAITATQILIAHGQFSLQLKGTMVSASAYASSGLGAIHLWGMGAGAVAAALGIAQALQLLYLAIAARTVYGMPRSASRI